MCQMIMEAGEKEPLGSRSGPSKSRHGADTVMASPFTLSGYSAITGLKHQAACASPEIEMMSRLYIISFRLWP